VAVTGAPELGRVGVRGGDLLVARWAGGAPVVLALHGGASSHRAWAVIARALAGEVTVVAPDLRGAAASTELPGPYGMTQHVADLQAVLDHLGVERAVVAGWSLGGFVAATFAARVPERATALVLVDGGLPLPLPPGFDPTAAVDELFEPLRQRFATTFRSRDEHRAWWRDHAVFSRLGLWSDDIEAHVDGEVAEHGGELRFHLSLDAIEQDTLETLADPSVREAALAVRCPTVFVRAERGLMDEETGYYPGGSLDAWEDPPRRVVVEAPPEHNHYTLMLSEDGAALVADAIRSVVRAREQDAAYGR
jgi:lipase